MTVLTDADGLYVGASEVDKLYLGSTQVWAGLDPDAAAFLTAAGISDASISSAIDDLVVSLKAAGLWTKMHAIYPFVGGTASTHKWNLKDPQNTDAAFRLTYVGGPTHSSGGMLPNLSGGYADTHFVPFDELAANSVHMAYYSRTQSDAGDKTEMGNYNWASTGNREHLLIRYSGDVWYYGMAEAGATNATGSTDSRGLFVGTRTAASAQKAYRNGTAFATSSQAGVSHATNSSWIGGINTYTAFTDRECAFASVGDGLSDGDVAALYTAVQAFQTTLGRQV